MNARSGPLTPISIPTGFPLRSGLGRIAAAPPSSRSWPPRRRRRRHRKPQHSVNRSLSPLSGNHDDGEFVWIGKGREHDTLAGFYAKLVKTVPRCSARWTRSRTPALREASLR